MHTPWFYCPVLHAGLVELDEDQARHAQHSLRLRPGDKLTVFDGRGRVAEGTLQEPATTAAKARRHGRKTTLAHSVCVDEPKHIPASRHSLSLIVAACKGARLDWLVEKCTELGVANICLCDFERSVVHVGAQHVERLTRVAIEACKQCRRAWLPHLQIAASVRQAWEERQQSHLLVAHPDPAARRLGDYLWSLHPQLSRITVVIGPEGGLSPNELDSLSVAGAQTVRLAEYILRVETAAVAVAATWANLQVACDVP